MKISEITLGTAQLGMEYGISNKIGKLSPVKATEILKIASSEGINCYDTARAYGNSEQVLGEFLKKESKNNIVITKIPNINEESFEETYNQIRKNISKSSFDLGINQIPICLLHEPTRIDKDDNMIRSIIKLKKEGLVKKIGISTYTPKEAKEFLDIPQLDVIQIPLNIFDTRLIHNNLLKELNNEKIMIFARSVYLQGLIGMEINQIPLFLEKAKPHIKNLKIITEEFKMNIREMALTFVRDLEEISSVIIGIESPEQLHANIKFLNKKSLSIKVRDRLMDEFSNLPEEIINPGIWKNT